MKYIPMLMSLDGELNALKYQSFSNSIIPLIQIIKDIKMDGGKASVLDDIEEIIKNKPNNTFFINVPTNLDLGKKKIKKPCAAFFRKLQDQKDFHSETLNKFSAYSNVIPVIEINYDSYSYGDLTKLVENVYSSSNIYAYKIPAKKFDKFEKELSALITDKDYLIYDIESYAFDKKTIKNERKKIKELKMDLGFKSIVIKQIYSDLTFSKYPDGLIESGTDAYDCIDFDFFEDFSEYDFDFFGDWAGIRNNPIYSGGVSYPTYLATEVDNLNHHGFKGIEKDPNSYQSQVLKKYLNSEHWNDILTPKHKEVCFGCKTIQSFENRSQAINSPIKWKCATISHYISTIDYKINNFII